MSKTFVERVQEVASPDDFERNRHLLDEVKPQDQDTFLDCLQSGLHPIGASVRMAPLMGNILERLTKVQDVESVANQRILWQQYVALVQASQTRN
ncbi:hypothetical protein [Telluribacter sp. SYSU D00476]|uniref:hypothetical protein n=1 Tax=Telluribacter sp. SYSU D00476 TaxID=2811430 RepID=UPI001FF4654C|nr:hypothetical protein [Telluribacter sp. SYSU D00476]